MPLYFWMEEVTNNIFEENVMVITYNMDFKKTKIPYIIKRRKLSIQKVGFFNLLQ